MVHHEVYTAVRGRRGPGGNALKVCRGVLRGTSEPNSTFKGAVLHNIPETVSGAKNLECAIIIGGNVSREWARRPVLRKGMLKRHQKWHN